MRGTCSSACLSRAFQKLIEVEFVDTAAHTFDDAFINGCAPRDGGEGGRGGREETRKCVSLVTGVNDELCFAHFSVVQRIISFI